MTGCLQKGDGSNFILTEVNRSRASVGTSGSDASGATVEREQLRSAAHAYRLTSDDDKAFDKLVGHQVRVSGTVAERADLPAGQASQPRTDASGNQAAGNGGANRERAKIDEADLAKVTVQSIDSVADACGGSKQ